MEENKQSTAKPSVQITVIDGSTWVYPFIRSRLRPNEYLSDVDIRLTIDRIADFAEGYGTLKTQQLTAREVQRWIPVEERLPDSTKDVLGLVKLLSGKSVVSVVKYTKGNEIEIDNYDDEPHNATFNEEKGGLYINEGWYEESEQQSGDYDSLYFERLVTHWMPLPNKPELT